MRHKNKISHTQLLTITPKKESAGWSDFQVLLSLMLLNLAGGNHVDDIRLFEKDSGFVRLFKHLELRNVWGTRRRQRIKRQWRNGKKNFFPSPSSIFRYLSLFHNRKAEVERPSEGSFIPARTAPLIGLSKVNKDILELLQQHRCRSVATIDMDATLVESQKKEAEFCYKGFKGYQPLNSWWWEQDYLVYSEFRDGNVPAGFEQRRVFEETLNCLPSGVKRVYLRSDSAGYTHELFDYCELGQNSRFGRIQFAIGAPLFPTLIKEIYHTEPSRWRPIHTVKKGIVQKSGQEWCEIDFVPEKSGRSKNAPEYRYIAIREKLKQKELPNMQDAQQEALPLENMRIGNDRYKLRALITNLDWYGETIVHWYRKRCGNSEQIHSEMKSALAGGTMPSKKFGANTAWWWIMILSLNMLTMYKIMALGKEWRHKKLKTIRYWLINIPGRVLLQSKELVVRICRGHPSIKVLLSARQRISLIGALNPG